MCDVYSVLCVRALCCESIMCGKYMNMQVPCESVEGWGWRRTHRTTESVVEGRGLGHSLAPAVLGGLDIPYTGSGVNGTIAVCVRWDSLG